MLPHESSSCINSHLIPLTARVVLVRTGSSRRLTLRTNSRKSVAQFLELNIIIRAMPSENQYLDKFESVAHSVIFIEWKCNAYIVNLEAVN